MILVEKNHEGRITTWEGSNKEVLYTLRREQENKAQEVYLCESGRDWLKTYFDCEELENIDPAYPTEEVPDYKEMVDLINKHGTHTTFYKSYESDKWTVETIDELKTRLSYVENDLQTFLVFDNEEDALSYISKNKNSDISSKIKDFLENRH